MTLPSASHGLLAVLLLLSEEKADTMRRPLLILLVGVLAGLAVGAGGAIAATGGGEKPDTEAAAGPEAIGGASAPGARLAVMVDGNPFTAGPPADFTVNRSVGVQSVINPVGGLFCIRPQAGLFPNSQLTRIVPSIAVGYNGSGQYRAFAQYLFPRGSQCPANTFAIRTFSEDPGGTLQTDDNDVQFTVVVD
jgi:hypothetical protein